MISISNLLTNLKQLQQKPNILDCTNLKALKASSAAICKSTSLPHANSELLICLFSELD